MNLREKMVKDLATNLKKEDFTTKIRTLKFLSKYSKELKIITQDLAELFLDQDYRIRIEAANVIKEAGEYDETVLEKIISALEKEDNIDARIAFIDILGISKSKRVIKILEKIFLQNSDDYIRQVAIEALSKLGFEEILPLILDATKDEAVNVRYTAINALRWIYTDEKIEPLLVALKDEESIVRASAAWALGTSRNNKQINQELISSLREDPDEYVRYNIMKTLGDIRNDDFVEILEEEADNDPEMKNRLKAIEILGEIATEKTFRSLLNIYKRTKSLTIQNKINFALRKADKSIIDELEEIKMKKEEKDEKLRHGEEVQALHNYRIDELHDILLNYKSMSMELFAGLLKLSNIEKITTWIGSLDEYLGLSIVKGLEYDSIRILHHEDKKVMNENIRRILKSFNENFEE